jgi:Protein of unknown function (DUF3617)
MPSTEIWKRGIQMIQLKAMILPAVMCVALGAATASHAQERMRTGMWEDTVTSSGRTSTRSHCFKPGDAVKSNGSPAVVRAETEKALLKDGACTLKDFKLEGNSLTLTMVCGSSTILQETQFHGGDSFETTMTHTDGGVSKVMQIKGRRTGDCKAGE